MNWVFVHYNNMEEPFNIHPFGMWIDWRTDRFAFRLSCLFTTKVQYKALLSSLVNPEILEPLHLRQQLTPGTQREQPTVFWQRTVVCRGYGHPPSLWL